MDVDRPVYIERILAGVDRSVYNAGMEPLDPSSVSERPARERILLTAYRLFYGQGIRATGIDQVIAEAKVAKVTFYRHFPSKHALILAFLDYRHDRWMAWFVAALQRHGGGPEALVPTLGEWFEQPGFRGCAFINSLAELGSEVPEAAPTVRRHKQAMTDAIGALLPEGDRRKDDAWAIALAVDGAIVRAQYDPTPAAALEALARVVRAILDHP